jgi:glutathione S-transferase
VGDSTNPIAKFLGGVFGIGVITRIVRGYTFLSRNYEPGDAIHICGFSRGAYTARALAGVITTVGLLDRKKYKPDSKVEAYRLGFAAWAKSKTLQLDGAGRLTKSAADFINSIAYLLAGHLEDSQLIPDVPLASVAVWDTVGSMGIPRYEATGRADILRFVNTSLSTKVARGFHAMAVDEMRADFPVTVWDNRDGVTQRWFIGAHADVGGGYPPAQCGLSDLPLSWMISNLARMGVRFVDPAVYQPNLTKVLTESVHTPYLNPPFDHLLRTPRKVEPGDDIDPSVKQRWQGDANYRPSSLSGVL